MVKKIAIVALLFCLSGCFHTRTAHGNIRFKPGRFTIKPNSNNDVFQIIDTTKLYELVDVIDTLYKQRPGSMKKAYLKFYANGRVGEFDSYHETDVKSLDPQKARMAYYNYDNKNLVIQFYLEHPQGGGLLTYRLNKIDKGNLELAGYNKIATYKILDLPKKFLISTPDW